MDRKDLKFESVIIKVFFTYLAVYFLALIFRYNYDIHPFLINVKYKYLIVFNMIFIFFGLPLSIIFDFILIKLFGLYYVLYFSPALTILSLFQIFILRKIHFRFSRIIFLKKYKKNYLFKLFENFTFRSSYILILRSFPIIPHILGSFIIASSNIKKGVIFMNTFLGSFFYYFFLYLIIGNV